MCHYSTARRVRATDRRPSVPLRRRPCVRAGLKLAHRAIDGGQGKPHAAETEERAGDRSQLPGALAPPEELGPTVECHRDHEQNPGPPWERLDIVTPALEGKRQAGGKHRAVDGQAALAETALVTENKVGVRGDLAAGQVVDVEDRRGNAVEAEEFKHRHKQSDAKIETEDAVDNQQPIAPGPAASAANGVREPMYAPSLPLSHAN